MIPGIISGAWRKRDPYWPYCVLAMHMDDAGLTDARGKTITLNGGVARSGVWSKFGGYSAYFDGAGDYLSAASSSDFGFGTGDFTIECWVKTTGTNKSIWDNRTTNHAGTGYIATTTGRIGFWNNTTAFEGTSNVADGAQHHLVWSRASGTLKLFVDGGVEYTGAMTSDLGASRPMRIGRDYLNAGDFFDYIDELRIYKGVAKWTSSFTVPSEAYPDA